MKRTWVAIIACLAVFWVVVLIGAAMLWKWAWEAVSG